MSPCDFIDNKAPQLAYYCQAFLQNKLDFKEIELYLWDILEEWQQLHSPGEAQSDIERVFWHTLHTLDQWPSYMLKGNQYLRQQIADCCEYLWTGDQLPDDVIGIRP